MKKEKNKKGKRKRGKGKKGGVSEFYLAWAGYCTLGRRFVFVLYSAGLLSIELRPGNHNQEGKKGEREKGKRKGEKRGKEKREKLRKPTINVAATTHAHFYH